jgi:AbrB family looped-hinge helix DNA binding protein
MTAIHVDQRGRITFPAEIREKYDINAGDRFHLTDLDGVLVFTPMASTVAELASEIEQACLDAGLSLEMLLADLREQRVRYYDESYGARQTI